MPDTICVNNTLQITNTSVGAQSWFWNFCVADLKTPPIGANLGNPNSTLNMPVFLDYAQYNDNWYGFSVNFGDGTLVRHNFGNGLLNTPTSTNLGNPNGVLSSPKGSEGIQVVFNEGKWYALIVGGYPGGPHPRIVKIEFGAALDNPNPTGTDWGDIGNMSQPVDLHVFKEGNNWYGLTVNALNNTITRFDFSNSFNNPPVATNLGNIGGLEYPTGIFAINDNGFWRVFITNGYDNSRTASTNLYSLSRLDFGSSLLNTPTGINLGNPGNVLNHPRDISIIRNCEQTVAFAVNGRIGQPGIVMLDFTNGLSQPPVGLDMGNIGNLSFAHSLSKLFRVKDDLYAFVTNVDNNTVTRMRFAGCTNANPSSFNGQNIPPIRYDAPGAYNINLTVDDGLPTQQSLCKQVVVVRAPEQFPTTRLYLCPGQPLTITAKNLNSKYVWNTGATTASIIVTTPGKYWADIDRFGCVATDSFIVEYYKDVDFNLEQNICDPYMVDFASIGTGVMNPSWDFGDGNTSSGALNVSHTYAALGTYTVSFTASNGSCVQTVTKTIRIDITREDLITTPDTIICNNTTAQLRSKPSLDFCWFPTDYLNAPRSPNPVTSAPNDITYYFNAKTTGTNLIVNGDFSAGNSGFTSKYTYTTNGIPEGTYGVVSNPKNWHTSFNECKDHTNGAGNMLVANGSAVLNQVVWEQTITVIPHTNYAFSTWISSLLPTNPAQLQFSINGNNLGGIISPSSTTCNWSQFYSTWNSGNNTTATIAIVNKNLQGNGNDFALDDISFAEVMIKRDSVKIIVEKPVITASVDTTVCKWGAGATLSASGGVNYSWSPANSLSDATIQKPVAKPTTRTEYTVTGKNARGCLAEDKVLVDLFPDIDIIKSPDTTVCRFASFPLRAAGGIAYTWTPAGNLNNSNSQQPIAQAGTEKMKFRVQVTDIHTCKKEDSIEVDILPYPVFEASAAKDAICLGKSTILHAGGGDQYSWAPAAGLDDPASSDPIASPAINTVYSVHIQDNTCGFDSTINLDLTVLPLPIITADRTNDINCNTPTAELIANGANSYSWFPATGLSDPSRSRTRVAIDTTTTFIVTGINQYGCESNAAVKVFVTKTGIPRFVVPNAFSPNGDGKNDCFGIQRWGSVKVEEMSIYNRWGQLLFKTSNPNNCWDGTFHGVAQPAGGYVYIIRVMSICGPVSTRGMLMLIR